MPILVTCPGCNRRLKVPDSARGKTIRCPSCKTAFQPPEEEPPPEEIPEVFAVEKPAPRRSAAPSRSPRSSRSDQPGRDYADAAGIDLDEHHNETVSDESFANRVLGHWKEEFPEVKSAYQPSGVMPAAALLWMSLGAGLGAPAGVLAAALVALISAVVLAIMGGIIALLAFCVVFCVTIILFVIVALVGYGITFAAQGFVSAFCTVSMGRLGKNRNATAAALMSMASAFLGVILMAGGLAVLGTDEAAGWVRQRTFEMVGEEPGDVHDEKGNGVVMWIAWGGLVVGAVISVVVAGVGGAQLVQDAKFCEDCEQYMEDKEMVELALGGVKTLARALGEHNIPVAVDLMNAPPGTHGKTRLFLCAGCGKGFVELTAQFKAMWQEKDDKKDKSETWLAGSVELTAEEVNLFQPHVRKS